jgi:hypothetical protein
MPFSKGRYQDEVTQEQADAMFEMWCKVQSLTQVAVEFKRSRATVHRIKHRDKWDERYRKIRFNVQKSVDKKAAQSIMSNLDYVTTLKKKLLVEILGKPQVDPTVRDLIALMEYEDKLLGNLPEADSGGADNIVNIYQIVREVNESDRLLDEQANLLGYRRI